MLLLIYLCTYSYTHIHTHTCTHVILNPKSDYYKKIGDRDGEYM